MKIYRKMPGPVPKIFTAPALWMVEHGMSNRKLAFVVGCHFTTIARLRAGKSVGRLVSHTIRAFYPSFPLPRAGKQTVYHKQLPMPERGFPNYLAATKLSRLEKLRLGALTAGSRKPGTGSKKTA